MRSNVNDVPSKPAWQRNLLILAVGACLASTSGCGGDGRETVYPTTGKVIVNGQPAAGAQVVLFPVDEILRASDHPLPTGVTDENGVFTLGSYAVGDGAPAGEYLVTIVWSVEVISDPNNPETPPAVDRLQDRYAEPDQSGLQVTISAGPTELEPFDLNLQ